MLPCSSGSFHCILNYYSSAQYIILSFITHPNSSAAHFGVFNMQSCRIELADAIQPHQAPSASSCGVYDGRVEAGQTYTRTTISACTLHLSTAPFVFSARHYRKSDTRHLKIWSACGAAASASAPTTPSSSPAVIPLCPPARRGPPDLAFPPPPLAAAK